MRLGFYGLLIASTFQQPTGLRGYAYAPYPYGRAIWVRTRDDDMLLVGVCFY